MRTQDVTPQIRYDMQLDALLARYRISEADYLHYIVHRIPEHDELNIERAEREIRAWLRGVRLK